jgi:hypothetical protein
LNNRFCIQVGELIEGMEYRGRAAPSAPRESCLARNASLQGPLFHGGAHSIVIFLKERFRPEVEFFRNLFRHADKAI